jgi:hypothetical protein
VRHITLLVFQYWPFEFQNLGDVWQAMIKQSLSAVGYLTLFGVITIHVCGLLAR